MKKTYKASSMGRWLVFTVIALSVLAAPPALLAWWLFNGTPFVLWFALCFVVAALLTVEVN